MPVTKVNDLACVLMTINVQLNGIANFRIFTIDDAGNALCCRRQFLEINDIVRGNVIQ